MPLSRRPVEKSFRTAAGLARLRHSQDETTKARDLFAFIQGWFTEGFDATDLKNATALLNELF